MGGFSVCVISELFLSCTHTLTSVAIQFSFVMNQPDGDEAVAAAVGGAQAIFVSIMVNIEPSTALLQSDIVVGITVIGGTATSKYHKYLVGVHMNHASSSSSSQQQLLCTFSIALLNLQVAPTLL